MKNKPLLIVESPTKVKTIQQYLGKDYDVNSCVGHVKDLPRKELGIDIENDFKIALSVLPDKKNFITELRKKSRRKIMYLSQMSEKKQDYELVETAPDLNEEYENKFLLKKISYPMILILVQKPT